MTLLKLTEDLWVNPDHVTSVEFWPEFDTTDDNGKPEPLLKVYTIDDEHVFKGEDAIRVRELFRPVLRTTLVQRGGVYD